MESRRPDVILLVGARVMVVELKGKQYPTQADVDQASAYARDLRNYHRECEGREVTPGTSPPRRNNPFPTIAHLPSTLGARHEFKRITGA